MKPSISKVRLEIENLAKTSHQTELQIVDKLNDYYFNKKVNENLKLYKKGKKKVSEITKDLAISPRKFYAILDKKKVQYKKYNKTTDDAEQDQ